MKTRRVLVPLLLVLLGLLLLAGCRMFRHRERPPFRRIRPPVAFEVLRDSPDVLVLDLRSRDEFLGDTGHIFRARNVPLERLTERLGEIEPFRDDTFLVYCRGNDTCGEKGMAILVSSGFENAMLVEGGIDGWIRAGFRTVLPEGPTGQSGAGSLPPPP